MKLASKLVLLSILAAGACAPAPPPTLTPHPRPNPKEVRALWVVRNTLLNRDSVVKMVERAQASGFNTLIVQVRGAGDAFYDSRWEPKPASLEAQKGFDPLALAIKEGHRRGMGVHAWLNTVYLTSMDRPSENPRHIYRTRPDLLAVPYPVARELYAMDPRDPRYTAKIIEWSKTARNRVEGLFMSPAAPETKEHLYSVWMDVLEKYDVDGLNFDFVRYPAPDLDYSRVSLDRFRASLEPELADSVREHFAAIAKSDPLVYADSFPARYADFRRQQVTDVVERIYYGVKKRRADVVVSADVFGNAKDAYNNRFQDWTGWLHKGILDVAALMSYSKDTPIFREQIRLAVEAGGPDRVWAGIGSWRIPVASTVEKIQAARELGARGIVLFSYDAAVRKGEFNPNADYLQQVNDAAFKTTPASR